MRHHSILLTAIAALFATSQLYAQTCVDMSQLGNSSVIQCANIDMGYDDQTGFFEWQFSSCSQTNHPRQTLITTNTKDNLCPMINTLPPNGTQSIRMASDAYPNNSFAKGEVIMIKYPVTADNYIALFKYAAIMEAPQHEIAQYEGFEFYAQPWISLYIADGADIIEASYTQHALSTIETVQDWQVYNGGRVPIIYKDWTTISYDLSDYIGKTINIVLEVYDCAEQDAWYEYDTYGNPYLQINTCDDHHLARVYCAIECGKLEEDQNCTARTTTITVPEGFTSYEWYDVNNQAIGTGQSVTVPLPEYPKTEETYYCYLSTSPYNDLEYLLTLTITDDCAHECPTIGDLTLVNKNCDGMSIATLAAPEDEGIQSYNWYDLNAPGVSLGSGSMITVTIPDDGTTYVCEMTMADPTCNNETKMIYVEPCLAECPTIPELSIVSRICEGMSIATLEAPEMDEIDTYNWYESSNPSVSLGTGSMVTVNVPFQGGSYSCAITMKDSRCSSVTKTVRVGACSGEAPVIVTPEKICADQSNMEISVQYQSAIAQSFDLIFSAQERSALKFENIMNGQIGRDGIIRVPVPHSNNVKEYVRPDVYQATLTVHPNIGNDTIVNFSFLVLYPSWVIRQQWNDVLAVLNKDYNGGYDISNVRWFKGNGTELEGRGAHNAYLYVGPNDKLEAGAKYWAELTRTDDQRAICTCELEAQTLQDNAPKRSEGAIEIAATNDFSHIHMTANTDGNYFVYNVSGMILAQGACAQDESIDIVLTHAGTYIIYFVGEDGTTDTKKWIVK